jgi:hypothetical protein
MKIPIRFDRMKIPIRFDRMKIPIKLEDLPRLNFEMAGLPEAGQKIPGSIWNGAGITTKR